MPTYWELAPPLQLADSVDCFWVSKQQTIGKLQRVVPDGCADILYTRTREKATLRFVGPMTRFEDVHQVAASCSVGIRFRPGMWSDLAGVSGHTVTDQTLPLQDLWGQRASDLSHLLEEAERPSQFVQLLAQAVPVTARRSLLQQVIAMVERSHGKFSLDQAAYAAGLSPRQFRRRCLDATGLSPKLLARILRFRYAMGLAVETAGRHAELAIECGYADQSHLIAEFQEFAGKTPRDV